MSFAQSLITVTLMVSLSTSLVAATKNGFDLGDSLVPENNIRQGGPPRDGIPSIDEPHFVKAKAASFMDDEDRVIGVSRKGITKAYPIKILNWHEIVNDSFDGEFVLVSFCPLCNTGMVFSAEGLGRASTFGVSGLLYNSDMLLFDRQTGSLWSQILGKSISGSHKGTTLDLLPSTHTRWGEWRKSHPKSLVLSTDTGFRRDYSRSPYMGYGKSRNLYFPVENNNSSYHPKELVLGVTINSKKKAYPFEELAKRGKSSFEDSFEGKKFTVEWQQAAKTARLLDEQGNEIPSVLAYWFAWYAFFPETEIFTAKK